MHKRHQQVRVIRFICESLVLNGLDRIQAQFDHLAETYFKDFDFDLGQRELGLVLSLDHDLDVYASSMGLTKTAVEAVLNDEGGFSSCIYLLC